MSKDGFEPSTQGFSIQCSTTELFKRIYLGLSRFELLTLRLSGVYSNQLSYKPINIIF